MVLVRQSTILPKNQLERSVSVPVQEAIASCTQRSSIMVTSPQVSNWSRLHPAAASFASTVLMRNVVDLLHEKNCSSSVTRGPRHGRASCALQTDVVSEYLKTHSGRGNHSNKLRLIRMSEVHVGLSRELLDRCGCPSWRRLACVGFFADRSPFVVSLAYFYSVSWHGVAIVLGEWDRTHARLDWCQFRQSPLDATAA